MSFFDQCVNLIETYYVCEDKLYVFIQIKHDSNRVIFVKMMGSEIYVLGEKTVLCFIWTAPTWISLLGIIFTCWIRSQEYEKG